MTAPTKNVVDLPVLGGVVTGDKLIVVDVSDTTEGPLGTVKVATLETIDTIFDASLSEAAASAATATTKAAEASASAALAEAIALGVASGRPSIRPTLNLDFVNSDSVDPRITFTRASAGAYYDGKTFVKAEENLLLNSQRLDNTGWSVTALAVAANTTTAPDGTLTAETLTPDVQNSFHRLVGGINIGSTTGLVLTYSVYVKANGYTVVSLRECAAAGGCAVFDLSGGGSVLGYYQTPTYVSGAVITDVGGGWFRISAQFFGVSSQSMGIDVLQSWVSGDSQSAAYAGDGTSGIFAWGGQVEVRSAVTAYTPTTTQSITRYQPKLLSAPAGVARFDHDPATGESLGLLVEPAATNLLTYSEDFSNAAWTKGSCTISSNVIIAPDGTLTGDKLVANSGAQANIDVGVVPGLANSTTYTLSVFAKAGEKNWLVLNLGSGLQSRRTYFNLSSGAIGTIAGGITATIKHIGNGWYRCTAQGVTDASLGANAFAGFQWADADGATAATGDAYSGLYIWGAQLEAGPLTSYIKTTGATATRAADLPVMTGDNFSSWYSPGQGTIVIDATPSVLDSGAGASINDGTTSNRIRLAYTSASDQATITANGTAQAVLDGGTPVAGTRSILALSYNTNDFGLSLDGAAAVTDTVGTVPVVTQMQIGGETSTVGSLTVRNVSFYPIALSDAEIQILSGSAS